MMAVHKYQLVHGFNEVLLIRGQQILSFDIDGHGCPAIWVLEEHPAPDDRAMRKIFVAFTGERSKPDNFQLFLGTAVDARGGLVYHAFDLGKLP